MAIRFNHPYTIKTISKSGHNSEVTDRLYDLGFIEGMSIIIEGRLPFGGAWIISSESLYVALRSEEFLRLELG